MNLRGKRWMGAVVAGIACVMLADSCAMAAVSITNRDDKEHKLTVTENEGGKKSEHVLKPNQVLEGLCEKGCIVRLNDSEEDEYELEGTEVVSIEEGYLYYDGPEGPAEQPAATPPGAAPTAPGAAPKAPETKSPEPKAPEQKK